VHYGARCSGYLNLVISWSQVRILPGARFSTRDQVAMAQSAMILLPETTRTPAGFTVEGASPEMLEQLLDAYAVKLKTRSPSTFDLMVPGLSRAQIEDALGTIGITPSAETQLWWQWCNGIATSCRLGETPPRVRERLIVQHRNASRRRPDPPGRVSMYSRFTVVVGHRIRLDRMGSLSRNMGLG
jgi:hypothetical protein